MTRRRTRSSRRRTPEAQLTSAFNRLVAERPVVAAILLAVVVLGAWLLLRDTGDADAGAAPQATRATHSTAGTTTTDPAAQRDPASGLPYIAESDLPSDAREVLEAIRSGGPFEFEQDGGHFGNYEGLLPAEGSSYYSEYTVQMPGDRGRGAHRFVVGDGGEIYWSTDHYQSFSVVKEGQ